MPVFIYKAVTKNGQLVRNRVEEMNRFILLKKLKNNDILPISVTQINTKITKTKKQKRNVESSNSVLKTVRYQELQKGVNKKEKWKQDAKRVLFSSSRITEKDIVIFTQNFYLLKKANFNNIHALSTVIESTENPSLKGIIEDILIGVEAGENMYSTMEYYSNVFPAIYINIIRVGELSGSLTKALEQAIKYMDETMQMNKKIKSVLIPNIVQFVVLLLLLVVGSLVSVPAIQGVFDQMGSKESLPGVTIAFSNFLNKLVAYWYYPVGVILTVVIAIYAYIRTPQGKYNFHYFKYKVPIFGQLIYAIDFLRLTRAVLLNIKNNMRIQDALETSKTVTNNLVMLSLVESAINNILIGQSWIEPFEQSGLSSPMITEMLRIGMQTDLAEMMEKLLEYMEIDINNIIEKVMKALPQIVYTLVGALLIFVVVVVVVPLLQVYMGGWLFSAYLE